MNILAVDENWWDRRRLECLLKQTLPNTNICVFDNTARALEFAEENPLGAAFIDIGRSIHIPGYFLAKEILKRQKTNIILTNYEWAHTQEMLELRVSGYIRKPLQYEDILDELQNLRYPLTVAGEAVRPPPEMPKNKKGMLERIANLF